MLPLIEALLALVELAVLVVFCAFVLIGWMEAGDDSPPSAADAYREALRAAAHVTRAAFEAERAMYAEAARHADDPHGLPPQRER